MKHQMGLKEVLALVAKRGENLKNVGTSLNGNSTDKLASIEMLEALYPAVMALGEEVERLSSLLDKRDRSTP